MTEICCWGVAVETSQTASVTALEPVQDPDAVQDEGLRTVWRSLSDTVTLCQLRFGLGTELDRCFSIAVEVFHNSFDLRRISFG